MHFWGDEWFQQHGDDLYEAIEWIEKRLHKYGIGVCGKEKYGTYRDEYLRLWDGGWCPIFFGWRIYYNANWFQKFVYWLDHSMIPVKKTQFGWLKAGLADFNRKIGLVKLVGKWQSKKYIETFDMAIEKWPKLEEELTCMTEYKYIKEKLVNS